MALAGADKTRGTKSLLYRRHCWAW